MKKYIIAGLLVWVPLGVTILVIKLLVDVLDQTLLLLPDRLQPEALFGFKIPGLGVALSVIIVLATGIVVANLFGRQLIQFWESMLARIPFVSKIYTGVKQVLETVLSSQGQAFRKVLLVEYPRRGMWTLAFQSSSETGEAQFKTGKEVINVFVPTTPNPTSGFFIMIPREDTVELEMSVDDGLKMIISAGLVVPQWSADSTGEAKKLAESNG